MPIATARTVRAKENSNAVNAFIITGEIMSFLHAFLMRKRNARTTAQSVIL
jgi:hypothetical protein